MKRRCRALLTTGKRSTEADTGRILVIGGCGYIGSHMVKRLLDAGHEITVLDNLSTGYADSLLGGTLLRGDFGDRQLLDRLLLETSFDGVLHFASLISVGESISEPAQYYRTNVVKTLTLLDALKDHGVSSFIYSSSAAVYGEPDYIPVDERHPCCPLTPYGNSKHITETILGDFDRAYGFKSVSLRYFNAAGADPQARIGERHEPETHLIPLALKAASGAYKRLTVFGRDYDTPDGTSIRDYVHVDDICEAHLLALDYLLQGGKTAAFNLGNGAGFSVQQVLETVGNVIGKEVPIEDGPRRQGDPARLVADPAKAIKILGWKPRFSDLEIIVRHAWQWELKSVLV